MSIISASVGAGGTNRPRDVRIVEFLLSRLLTQIYPDQTAGPNGATVILGFAVDGKVNERTVRVIRDFQKRLCGMERPDGRIDPNRKTIAILTGLFVKARCGVAPLSVREAVRRVNPHSMFSRPREAAIFQGGIFQAGQTVLGFDGRRLILSITPSEAIFVLIDREGAQNEVTSSDPLRGRVGTIYVQETIAFLDERDSSFLLDLSQRLESGVQRIQTFQINMTLGALSAIHGGVSAALTIGSVVSFVIQHRELLASCLTFLEIYVRVRRVLKAKAPRLCEKIEAALLRGVTRGALVAIGTFGDDVFGNLGQASNTPDVLGKLLGVLAGIAGSALAGRFAAVRTVLNVLLALVVRAASAIPGAVTITAAEKLTTAREIARQFQGVGVPTTFEEAQTIVQEILTHPAEVRSALQDLGQAAVALRATAS